MAKHFGYNMLEIDEERITKQVSECVKMGMTVKASARAVGIVPRTLLTWTERGEEELLEGLDTCYTRLVIAINRADSEFVARNLQVISRTAQAGGKIGWCAAAWLLERTHPDDFAESKRLDIGVQQKPVEIINDVPTDIAVGAPPMQVQKPEKVIDISHDKNKQPDR